jgi:dipeptidyl-peptidase-4
MRVLLLLLTFLLPATLFASPPSEPKRDPFLDLYAQTRRFTSGRPVQPEITPDDKTILFLRAQPKSNQQTLFAFDVATGTTTEVVTPETLLKGAEETLSAAEKARRERMRVSSRGLTSYQLSEDGERILLALSGKSPLVQPASGQVRQLKNSARAVVGALRSSSEHA